MGGSNSTVNNSINNKIINKSDIESLNQQVNEYVSNSVTSNASSCSASSTNSSVVNIKDIVAKGPGSVANIDASSEQDVQLTLQCIQTSVQQTNIGNDIAQSIMNNLLQSVSADVLNKAVGDSEASLKSGYLANPFAESNSKVNINVSTENLTETNRKISNLISNKVANNVKTEDIKNCFMTLAQNAEKNVGNIVVLDGAQVNLNLSSKQVARGFSTCKQLTEQTSAVTNEIATALGLTVYDDTKTKTTTETESISTSKVEASGVEGVVSAFGSVISAVGGIFGNVISAALLPYVLYGCVIFCCCICCIILLFVFKGKKNTDQGKTEEKTEGQPEEQPEDKTEEQPKESMENGEAVEETAQIQETAVGGAGIKLIAKLFRSL